MRSLQLLHQVFTRLLSQKWSCVVHQLVQIQLLLGSGSKEFDIASVSAQADVGTYLNDFTITLGRTYTHVRSTINATMTTKGTVDVSGTTCNTVASPTVAAASAHSYS